MSALVGQRLSDVFEDRKALIGCNAFLEGRTCDVNYRKLETRNSQHLTQLTGGPGLLGPLRPRQIHQMQLGHHRPVLIDNAHGESANGV